MKLSCAMDATSPPKHQYDLGAVVVCRRCDGLFQAAALEPTQNAKCPDCGEILLRNRAASIQFVLAAALSGAMFLAIAIAYPVLGASLGGLRTEVNLVTAPDAFLDTRFIVVAWVMVLISVLAPGIQVAALCWLLIFALRQRRAPGFSWLLSILRALRPWAMLEVFLLGSLIVIVKIGSWVSVILGPGLWALSGFACLVAALRHFEASILWTRSDLR
ncbi:MAG TPA: paraquat-inducible protein A [Steroidobacteraceae bacterium]|jgi:paraquat-inducible protein A